MGHQFHKVLIAGFTTLVLTLNPLPLLQTETRAVGPSAFTKPYAGVYPVSGNRRLLVILLRAQDSTTSVTRQTIRNQIFGPAPSVSTYLNEISHGRFNISEACVTRWLVAQDDPSTPGVNESLKSFVHKGGAPHEQAKAEWLIQAVDNDNQTNFNWSDFDDDKDGWVTPRELLILWVYPGGDSGRSRKADPNVVQVDGLKYGVKIPELARVGENANWRLIAHELLHQVCGLSDLYIDDSLNYAGVGGYSIMCASGAAVHLDPWAKMKLGWLQPQVVTCDGWYFLNDVERTPQALIVHDPARGTKDYFILENRWPGTSHEQNPFTHAGLVVWRIEEKHDNPDSDWGRKTIDRIWAQGEVPKASRVKDNCPGNLISVFQGNTRGVSYALTPTSSPGNLRWRDGKSSNIGLWFYSQPGPVMRVYIDVPPLQAGSFRGSLAVSVGSSRNLAIRQSPQKALLAKERSENDLIDIGIARDGHAYAWYRDGTLSAGAPRNLGNYRRPQPFSLPPGRSPYDIVGMAIASDDHVYAWYRDGTVSAGSSRNLASYRAPRSYTLAPGKAPLDIVSIGIARDDHVYVWYRDGTVSAGTSIDLDHYRPRQHYTSAPGRHLSTILAVAIDPSDQVHAWYRDPISDVATAGPVQVGAYLDPQRPAVQPGMISRVIVRAHRPDGKPLVGGQVFLQAEAGLFRTSSAPQVAGQTSAAGFFATEWRAPDASLFTRNETYIHASVKNAQGHIGRVRVKVPILRQRIR
jgi:M6 family metalloprotease-like protein